MKKQLKISTYSRYSGAVCWNSNTRAVRKWLDHKSLVGMSLAKLVAENNVIENWWLSSAKDVIFVGMNAQIVCSTELVGQADTNPSLAVSCRAGSKSGSDKMLLVWRWYRKWVSLCCVYQA